MTSNVLVGYLAAVIMGATLGLLGGGGSIFTLPILVYLFHIETVQATAYSLFVVGLTALIGSVGYLRRQLVDFKVAIAFGLPCIAAVFFARRFIVPAIPDVVRFSEGVTVSKAALVMLLFSVIMFIAAISIIRGRVEGGIKRENLQLRHLSFAFIEGVAVGCVTGVVGVGGGFLIVPALVVLVKLPVRTAIGTSLVVMSTNSLIGFTGDLSLARSIDWPFLLAFSGAAIVGMLVGLKASDRVPAKRLRPIFGYFVLLAATLILLKELCF